MSEIKEENNPQKWFIRRGKTLKGPFSSAKIRHHINEERLLLSDEVSLDKLSWQTIANVPEVVPLSMRQGDEEDERLLAVQNTQDKRRAWITIVILVAIVLGVIFMVVEIPQDEDMSAVDCNAAARVGVNWHGCRMSNQQLTGVNLSGADLGGISMMNTNLTESTLKKTNLRYGNLSSANLAYSDFTGADFKGANLAGADLTNANFTEADLSHADLSGVQLGGAIFTKAKLSGTIWADGKRCNSSSIGKCEK